MDQNKFELWVKKILETEDEEISCSECFDLVSTYVEIELSGTITGPVMARLENHLKQCLPCREEYEVLRDLASTRSSG
jgi:hypothetical protein